MNLHPTRRRTRALAIAAAAVGMLTLATPAAAQSTTPFPNTNGSGYDLRLYRPAVDSKGQFAVNGTDILGAGDVSFGLGVDVGSGLMRVGRDGAPLVSSYFTGILSANVGIGNVVAVGAQIPVALVSGPGATNNDGSSNPVFSTVDTSRYNPGRGLNFQGLGDVSLHVKLRWLRVEYFPIGLAIILQGGWSPMNSARSFAGEPNGYLWPQVAIERRALQSRVRLDLNVGLRAPLGGGSTIAFRDSSDNAPPGVFTHSVTYGPSLTWGAGASFRAAPVIDLVVETYGQYLLTAADQPQYSLSLEVVGGIKLFLQRNSYLMLGGGSGLRTGLAAADVRAFLGFVYEPSIGDTDGDGYRDDVDRCINDPEDRDGFEDDDGCSDPDNDRDGIPDVNDSCPLIPEDRDGDADQDGCPEGQEADSDGDGILDNVDHCVDDPEDRDGFQDDDGCPDPDNDQDGILDTLDSCPNDPEDIDGFQDDDGCPDPDNDQDGILDHADRCPNEPEVLNGVDDDDGCPDSGDLQILGNVISLREQIQFETDSAEIRAVSSPILEQMANLMRRNPQFELVEVEGHTDERANDDHNLQLSRDRANAVAQAVIQRGIDASRLVSAGYGELCPIDPGHTPRAWERNRRVQFVIVRTHDEGRTTAAAGCRRGAQYIPPSVGAPGTGVARERSHEGGGAEPAPAPAPAPTPAPAPNGQPVAPAAGSNGAGTAAP